MCRFPSRRRPQQHFDVPEPIKAAARRAIDQGHNGYTVSQIDS
jgi:hypothetical protein